MKAKVYQSREQARLVAIMCIGMSVGTGILAVVPLRTRLEARLLLLVTCLGVGTMY
jgi:hypothetical protein